MTVMKAIMAMDSVVKVRLYTEGAYKCDCNEGYNGNGFHCNGKILHIGRGKILHRGLVLV